MKRNQWFIGCLVAMGWMVGSVRAADPVIVILDTSRGEIRLELDAEKAPTTVANFVKYVQDGHYDGVIFHRVIEGFMIQAGGYTEELSEKKTREPIKNESDNGLENKKYTIAMARTSEPHSASAQFFINTADNDFLDRKNARDRYGYAVFGKVVEGKKVVDEIEKVRTTRKKGMDDVPVDTIIIKKASIEETKE